MHPRLQTHPNEALHVAVCLSLKPTNQPKTPVLQETLLRNSADGGKYLHIMYPEFIKNAYDSIETKIQLKNR